MPLDFKWASHIYFGYGSSPLLGCALLHVANTPGAQVFLFCLRQAAYAVGFHGETADIAACWACPPPKVDMPPEVEHQHRLSTGESTGLSKQKTLVKHHEQVFDM